MNKFIPTKAILLFIEIYFYYSYFFACFAKYTVCVTVLSNTKLWMIRRILKKSGNFNQSDCY